MNASNNLQDKHINLVEAFAVLHRRAHLTSDYAKASEEFLVKVGQGHDSEALKLRYYRAQHFLRRQIRLQDKKFNSYFARLGKAA